jgi:hypothetical protein
VEGRIGCGVGGSGSGECQRSHEEGRPHLVLGKGGHGESGGGHGEGR